MLIRFEVSNFRSILEPVELSLVAIDKDRPSARKVDGMNERILSVAGIFGPNASGKSNVISAISWLKDAIALSLRNWDDVIPIQPFAFGGHHSKNTTFEIEMTVDGVRFEYLLELDSDSVKYEALFHYPEKKRRRVFEREGNELKLQRGLGILSGTRDLLTSRSLVLSIARRFEEPTVSKFAWQLLRIQLLGQTQRRRPQFLSMRTTMNWFEENIEGEQPSLLNDAKAGRFDRDLALSLLRMADLGIEDVVFEEVEPDSRMSSLSSRQRVRLIHKSGSESLPFEMQDESAGTQIWFTLIGPTLNALRRGSILLFDELDASLHPILTAQLLDLFQDPKSNPYGSQLIFTSHDTNLLNHLNRDEVWLTEKEPDGSTELKPLADFGGKRVRQSQNLESGYLHGRFGGVPDVDKNELLDALWDWEEN